MSSCTTFACKCLRDVTFDTSLGFNSVDYSELGASYLFTAHHSDDQVETFLLRVAHYSNSDGLAGMYRIKKFMDITVVRPLLSLSKVRDPAAYAELLMFVQERAIATCMASNQPWVEDPSNESDKYHRSR